jgi:pilus assembly protein TadC
MTILLAILAVWLAAYLINNQRARDAVIMITLFFLVAPFVETYNALVKLNNWGVKPDDRR